MNRIGPIGRLLQRYRPKSLPQRPPPSTSDHWSGRLGGPAARYLTDLGDHEFVVERSCLAPALTNYYASEQLPAELREIVEAWAQPAPADAPLIAELPLRWRSFANIATELIKQRRGHFRCSKCQEIYPATEVQIDRSRGGTEYVTVITNFLCPNGHTLISQEAHFRMKVF